MVFLGFYINTKAWKIRVVNVPYPNHKCSFGLGKWDLLEEGAFSERSIFLEITEFLQISQNVENKERPTVF